MARITLYYAGFSKRHILDFDQSPESAKKIQDYLVQHNLDFSENSLDEAFQALRAQGVSLTVAAPVAPAPVAPAAPAEDALSEVPVPGYMERVRTCKDIRDLSPEVFTKWRKGPDRDAFFKRLEFIKQRGL
jgi:hypothetical protein